MPSPWPVVKPISVALKMEMENGCRLLPMVIMIWPGILRNHFQMLPILSMYFTSSNIYGKQEDVFTRRGVMS
jgi:hypothetical protein